MSRRATYSDILLIVQSRRAMYVQIRNYFPKNQISTDGIILCRSQRMERRLIIVLSIIIIAVISAIIIAYYQSTSSKVVGAQCDKTKKICQIQSETTHFGGYFPVYSYYYIPFPLFGPGLGLFYPGSFIRPNVCDDCLTKVTPQDEQEVLNSKTPVPQSELPSEQQPSSSQSPSENNPGSESGNPGEQSPSTSESPPASSPGSSPSSPPSEGSGRGESGSSGGTGDGGAGEGGSFGGGGGGDGGGED